MAKNLVIVESPAKAKTIEGYLGSEFIVKSSYGHVRDLAKKGLAIEIDNKFISAGVKDLEFAKFKYSQNKEKESQEIPGLLSDSNISTLLHSLGSCPYFLHHRTPLKHQKPH